MRFSCKVIITLAIAFLSFSSSARSQVEYLNGKSSGIGGQLFFTKSSSDKYGGISAALGLSGRTNIGVSVADVPDRESYGVSSWLEQLIFKGKSLSPAMFGIGASISSIAGDQSVEIYLMAAKRLSAHGKSFVQPTVVCGVSGLGDNAQGLLLGAQCGIGTRFGRSGSVIFLAPEFSMVQQKVSGFYGSSTKTRTAGSIRAGLIIAFGKA